MKNVEIIKHINELEQFARNEQEIIKENDLPEDHIRLGDVFTVRTEFHHLGTIEFRNLCFRETFPISIADKIVACRINLCKDSSFLFKMIKKPSKKLTDDQNAGLKARKCQPSQDNCSLKLK